MAMVVGIITGTYSSIYIASPVTIWLEEQFGKHSHLATGTEGNNKKKDEGSQRGAAANV
jgi:hypothetical protein